MSGIKDVKRRRERRRRRRQIRRLIVIFSSLFLCVGLVLGVRGIIRKITEPDTKEPKKKTSEKPKIDTSNVKVENFVIKTNKEKTKDTVSLTISSMGDYTLGTDEFFNPAKIFNAYYNAQGADYFLKNVRKKTICPS